MLRPDRSFFLLYIYVPDPELLADSEGSVLKAPWKGGKDRRGERGTRDREKGLRPGSAPTGRSRPQRQKGRCLGAESELHRALGPMKWTVHRSAPFLSSTISLLGSGVTLTDRGPIMTMIKLSPCQERIELRVEAELISGAFLALLEC